MSSGTATFNGMPAAVEEIFGALWQDVGNLNSNWTDFCQLYGTSPERIKLLRRYGGMFWGRAQQSLYRNVLLRISHLTDKPTSGPQGRFKNQSLPRLLLEVGFHDPSLLVTLDLQAKYDQFDCHCGKIRDLRNRALAHRDWDADVNPLPATARQEIADAISMIYDIMNIVQFHFSGSRTFWNMNASPGDAEYVIKKLEKLARIEDEEWREKGLPGSPWS
jgi:hypothetical protein